MPDPNAIVEICHRVYDKGFVSAYDGNISAITDHKTILITRSGVCKGDVKESDIMEINFAGESHNRQRTNQPVKHEGAQIGSQSDTCQCHHSPEHTNGTD